MRAPRPRSGADFAFSSRVKAVLFLSVTLFSVALADPAVITLGPLESDPLHFHPAPLTQPGDAIPVTNVFNITTAAADVIIAKAEVTIESGAPTDRLRLSFLPTILNNTFDSSSLKFTLFGNGSVTDYRDFLNRVAFWAPLPGLYDRVISFVVTTADGVASNTVTRSVVVHPLVVMTSDDKASTFPTLNYTATAPLPLFTPIRILSYERVDLTIGWVSEGKLGDRLQDSTNRPNFKYPPNCSLDVLPAPITFYNLTAEKAENLSKTVEFDSCYDLPGTRQITLKVVSARGYASNALIQPVQMQAPNPVRFLKIGNETSPLIDRSWITPSSIGVAFVVNVEARVMCAALLANSTAPSIYELQGLMWSHLPPRIDEFKGCFVGNHQPNGTLISGKHFPISSCTSQKILPNTLYDVYCYASSDTDVALRGFQTEVSVAGLGILTEKVSDPFASEYSLGTIIAIVIGIIAGVICLERLISSCRTVYRRRRGLEGFQQMDVVSSSNRGSHRDEELELEQQTLDLSRDDDLLAQEADVAPIAPSRNWRTGSTLAEI